MELEPNNITERIIGSFFRVSSVLIRGQYQAINASKFDKPWPQKDTDETRKWIEMELEHNNITERMIGSFSVFHPC